MYWRFLTFAILLSLFSAFAKFHLSQSSRELWCKRSYKESNCWVFSSEINELWHWSSCSLHDLGIFVFDIEAFVPYKEKADPIFCSSATYRFDIFCSIVPWQRWNPVYSNVSTTDILSTKANIIHINICNICLCYIDWGHNCF